MAEAVLNPPIGFAWVQRLLGWRHDSGETAVLVESSDKSQFELWITCLGDGIWRISCSPDGVDWRRSAQNLPILINLPQAKPLQIKETSTELSITGGEAGRETSLIIRRDPWRLALQNSSGQTLWRENPDDVDGLNRLFILPFGFVRGDSGEISRMTQAFHLTPGEHLYGLGEKFTRLDKNGQRIESWTLDALGAASERAYKNIPLLIGTQDYTAQSWGLFIHTANRCRFDLGAQSCESATLEIDGGILDCFLLAGETPADILRLYTGLTGRSPLPPRWSFGLWLSGSGIYRDDASIRRLAQDVDKYDIPCDVIHIDPWWMRWRRYADFQWDLQAFPNPADLLADLHAAGLKLSVWQHSYISIESELFAEGRQRGYFALRPDGEVYVIDYGLSLSTLPGGVTEVASENSSWNARVAIIDLTNPQAVEWYKALMRPVLEQGLDVFKTDFGEDIPLDARFADGRTGAELHNLYPLLYNQAVFEVTKEVKGVGLVWARSGWAGSQRFPVCWSGDPACTWDSLAFTLRGGLSLGLSGVPFWSNDIGGYRGQPDEKLYIRWAQFGLLCSHARCHGESQREPWFYGERAQTIFRKFARLRYQLFPYLYSCAHEAAQNGLPVLRAMPLAFPQDPNCASKDFQSMLGPDLLIAPVLREDSRCSVYLPAGEWVDFWSEQALNGPQTLELEVPLDRLPIYVRAGAALPMIDPTNRIPAGRIDPLVLHLYPAEGNRPTESIFLEDEGQTRICMQRIGGRLKLEWSTPAPRTVRFYVHFQGQIDGGTHQMGVQGACELELSA